MSNETAIARIAELEAETAHLKTTIKPLGGKAYGHIPHLPGSRLGPADHTITAGQSAILTTMPRKGDKIIVSEKVDGCCMAIANVDGELVALGKAGYLAKYATWPHMRQFADYVAEHRPQYQKLLQPGERLVGDWLGMAHGTRYLANDPLFEPFVTFDIIRNGKRVLHDEFIGRTNESYIMHAFTIHNSHLPLTINDAMQRLSIGYDGCYGFHGSIDPVEGAVWRVEREGRVDFLAKYVIPEKIDGQYLPNISGADPIWYWRPPAIAA